MKTPFVVVSNDTGNCVGFWTPKDAALHLWGRDTLDFSVYLRIENIPSEITEIQKRLTETLTHMQELDK